MYYGPLLINRFNTELKENAMMVESMLSLGLIDPSNVIDQAKLKQYMVGLDPSASKQYLEWIFSRND